jgi:hypothetical protein
MARISALFGTDLCKNSSRLTVLGNQSQTSSYRGS